ncbi:MAG: phosphate ABC transporter substrate-binding protein [Pirellulales bacterium]|nr:phosphate ABC transporter substrate-binding protein [Pirellulales bacterium]
MKRVFVVGCWLTVIAGLLAFTSCGRSDRGGSGKGPGGPTQVTIKGSDTMVHLASTWAEAFMKEHPDINVSVTGGGSGTGIAALINGTTDLCAASREMKPEELQMAKEKDREAKEFVVGRDGIAVVVNPANPIKELTVEQIRKIYTGAYEKWSQVGGPDEKIIVLSRESSSGTYVFFQEHVLNKKDYRADARLMPATSAIIQSVASEKSDIGYVGLGYATEAGNKIKTLGVKKDDASPVVMPSEATVVSGEYAIARPLYLYTPGEPTGAAKQFIDFCLGPKGQEIVRETGYVPLGPGGGK